MTDNFVEFPTQEGTLVAGHVESSENRAITLYGDREGLKSLGQLLIAVSELDQSKFKKGDIMDDYGFHLHLLPVENLHHQSLEIVVGRLDAICGGKFPEWIESSKSEKKQPIRVICSSSNQ